MSGVLIKRGNLTQTWTMSRLCKETQGEHYMNVEDWNNAYASLEMTEITNKPWEARREAWNWFFLIVLSRKQPCPHFDFRLLAFRIVRLDTSVILKHLFFVVLCDGCPRKLISWFSRRKGAMNQWMRAPSSSWKRQGNRFSSRDCRKECSLAGTLILILCYGLNAQVPLNT